MFGLRFRSPLTGKTTVFDPSYSNARKAQEFAVPVSAVVQTPFATKENERGPWATEQGWAPGLRTSPTGTPDSARVGADNAPPRVPTQSNSHRSDESFWAGIDANKAMRSRVETVEPRGWQELNAVGYEPASTGFNRWAPNPRATPSPNSRVTQSLSPRSYSMVVDIFNQPKHEKRTFNGLHFSMADNKRKYAIYGMQPTQTKRNTYRLTPEPWDTNIVDMPPAGNPAVPDATVTDVFVPPASRAFRLV